MMHRNLDRRVEVMAQVKDPRLAAQLDDTFESAMDPVHPVLGTGHRRAVDGLAAGRPHGARPPGVADGTPPAPVTDTTAPPRTELRELRCRKTWRPVRSGPKRKAVPAAGAVLWRTDGDDPQPLVALIHRPRYDDWSLPKGKVDPGETEPVTAVREVARGDRAAARIWAAGSARVSYPVDQGVKKVRYWAARRVDGEFAPNDEVDELIWLPVRRRDEAGRIPARPEGAAPVRRNCRPTPRPCCRPARHGGRQEALQGRRRQASAGQTRARAGRVAGRAAARVRRRRAVRRRRGRGACRRSSRWPRNSASTVTR